MSYIRCQLGDIAGTLFANWLASLFYFSLPFFYDIKLDGLQNYSASASTLITINHKRDLDLLVVAPILHLPRPCLRINSGLISLPEMTCSTPASLPRIFQYPGLGLSFYTGLILLR